MRRREWLTAVSTATIAGIAGCTGSDESEPAANGDDGTENSTENEQEDEQEPEEMEPTLDDFEFPEHASREGLEAADFVAAHLDYVRDAGSVTVVESTTREDQYGNDESETEARIGSDGILVTEEDGTTVDMWTEHESNRGFVRRDHGFQTAYQLTDEAVSVRTALLERDATNFADGFEFGEAAAAVEIDGTVTARYDVTGVADSRMAARLVYGQEITDATGSAFVTEDGLLKRFEYDLESRGDDTDQRQTAEVTYGDVGSTTVSEPEWVATAREDGRLLEATVTDDGYLEFTLVNGKPLPEGTLFWADIQGMNSDEPLPDEVAVDDRIIVAANGNGASIAVNEKPASESNFSRDFVHVSFHSDGNTLYSDNFTFGGR